MGSGYFGSQLWYCNKDMTDNEASVYVLDTWLPAVVLEQDMTDNEASVWVLDTLAPSCGTVTKT